MVRVLLDATAVPADRGGVGRYVDSLLPALVRAGAQVRVVCQQRDREYYAELSGTEVLSAPRFVQRRAARLVWEQTGLAAIVRRVAPDVLHMPHYTQPVLAGVPLVVTLHDATFFTDPGVHLRVKAPFFRAATRLAIRRARCCIVPSVATADALVRSAGADPDRLQVAYLGVDQDVFHPPAPADIAAARALVGVPEGQPYIAFLGTLEPRKNVPALVRGYVQAFRGRPDAPALVLAGGRGWDHEVDAAIASVPPNLLLLRTGFLPTDSLAGLLGGAELVTYPSLGEGFGLPVLEAMACGAPVLTTRRLSLPEVGGEAVAYTEPDSPAIAAALADLVDDRARRTELAAAGLARSAEFTWDACAESHLVAYERAVAGVSR